MHSKCVSLMSCTEAAGIKPSTPKDLGKDKRDMQSDTASVTARSEA